MSLGYATRLSHREDLGGRLGDPEVFDRAEDVLAKTSQLANLVRKAKRVMAFTGAGISTSCGIPDFRGPKGVWTCQRSGKPLPKLDVSFVYAKPSLTHQALLGLLHAGKLTYICSQNVDGLHLRSGVPRSQLAELHGDCFAERCKRCSHEYVRDFEMDTVGFKPTGRSCSQPGCGGQLEDSILDWEDPLPDDELDESIQQAKDADVSLCLGTSLQITPAANIPLRTLRTGGSLAIVNLQATPKDRQATLVIHARVDAVMAALMWQLELPIPVYRRVDRARIWHSVAAPQLRAVEGAGDGAGAERASRGAGWSHAWSFTLNVGSVHGSGCPMPMVQAVRFEFPQNPELAAEVVAGPPPFAVARRVLSSSSAGSSGACGSLLARVQLLLGEHAAPGLEKAAMFEYKVEPAGVGSGAAAAPSLPDRARRAATAGASVSADAYASGVDVTFTTQLKDYSEQQRQLVVELEEAAAAGRAAAAAGGAAAAHSGHAVPGNGGGGAVAARSGAVRGRARPGSSSGGSERPRRRAAADKRYDETAADGGSGDEAVVGADGASSRGRVRKRARRLNM